MTNKYNYKVNKSISNYSNETILQDFHYISLIRWKTEEALHDTPLSLFYIYHLNQASFRNDFAMMTAP